MNMTLSELRDIKHQLPTGSINRIASRLNMDEQSVRNYFGAKKYEKGSVPFHHVQPGPDGGIISINDPQILNLALEIIEESRK